MKFLALASIVLQGLNLASGTIITESPSPTPLIAIRAAPPVSAGQIGVNPVESDLGNPTTYIGQIFGSDTQYITVISVSTAVSTTNIV